MAFGDDIMMPSENVRKAALVASLMDRKQRKRLLASLPADATSILTTALREIEQHGWAQRDLVERVLGKRLSELVTQEGIGLDALMVLSKHLDSLHFARILTATQPGNPEFVLSMLDQDFAEGVQAHIDRLPVMPESLRAAVRAHARTLLDDSGMKVRT